MLKEETLFKNFSNEHFAWKYDGVEYEFEPSEVRPMEKGEALLFAKHLVDREMMRDKLTTNHHSRPEYEAKATQTVSPTIHTEPELAEEEVSNVVPEVKEEKEEVFEGLKETRFCNDCVSKGGRHLKGCPTIKQ